MASRPDPSRWRVYAITDARLAGRPHLEAARLAIEGGADAIQLRDKTAGGRSLYEAGRALREAAAVAGVALIVNDRVDIALAVGADGVHLGRDDLPVAEARRILGPGPLIGASVRTRDEAGRAAADGADYLGVGPVYEARGTKPGVPPPLGPGVVRDLAAIGLPVLAIGGVRPEHVPELAAAGASGVAAISAIMGAGDIRAAARAFRDAWTALRREPLR